jgi:hypothetical protein
MTLMRQALLLTLAGALLPTFAHAQGRGIAEGRLVNVSNPANIPAQVTLDVISLAGGMSVVKSAVTDAAGKFKIEGLPTDSSLLIRASYGEVKYYGQAAFDASGKAQVDIQIYEATTSLQGITLETGQLAFKLAADGLSTLESYTYKNESKPLRSFMRADGTFRFSKAPGIAEPPMLSVMGPGATMPVNQPPLESPDGQSYYSQYPLRPGTTTFEVAQVLPYQGGGYTYRKKFFQDMPALGIGVVPRDMKLSGNGLTLTREDAAQNMALYSTGPIKAGTEVVWTFSGGTPVVEIPQPMAEPPAAPMEGPGVRPMPTEIGRNAVVIGALMLIGFVIILWYAHNRVVVSEQGSQDARNQELKERREQLLDYVVALDLKHEKQELGEREYQRLREQAKRHLRRVMMLVSKK